MGKIKKALQSSVTPSRFSPEQQAILRQRALLLAREESVREQAGAQEEYLGFLLGKNERYAIPYRYLDEVMPPQPIVRVPCAPAFVAGVFNCRGEMVTVLETRRYFGVAAGKPAEECHIVIVSARSLSLGLLVDELTGNGTYFAHELEETLPSGNFANLQCIRGIYQGNTALIDPGVMLADPVFRTGEI